MSFPYYGKKPSQLKVYDPNSDGNIIALVAETDNGEVCQIPPSTLGGNGGTANREEKAFINRSTNGWFNIGQPIPAELNDFQVLVNGVDRNSQTVVEVDQIGQKIRCEDTDSFDADKQVISWIAPN